MTGGPALTCARTGRIATHIRAFASIRYHSSRRWRRISSTRGRALELQRQLIVALCGVAGVIVARALDGELDFGSYLQGRGQRR